MAIMNSKRRRWAAAGAALAVAAAVGLALLKGTPQVYERTARIGPNEEAIARFNGEVVNAVLNLLLDQSGETRLDFRVTEEMVNARLARLVGEEARGGGVPPALQEARVGFESGRIVLATRIGQGLSSVVVAQRLRLGVDAEGRLRVESAGVTVGLLPVPEGVMNSLRRALAARLAQAKAAGEEDMAVEVWRYVLEVLDGKPVSFGKGRKRIVLDAVEVNGGMLRVRGHRKGGGTVPPPVTEPARVPPSAGEKVEGGG